jgi:cytochrome c-type biogenesis protein CcmH/NrfG
MKNENLSFEQAIALIEADGQKDHELLTKVEKLRSELHELEQRNAAGTISEEDFKKDLLAINDQLTLLIEEDLKADHPDYDSLVLKARLGRILDKYVKDGEFINPDSKDRRAYYNAVQLQNEVEKLEGQLQTGTISRETFEAGLNIISEKLDKLLEEAQE